MKKTLENLIDLSSVGLFNGRSRRDVGHSWSDTP
jgi:hypothetical protein